MKTLGWPPNFVARCPVKLFEAAGGSNSWLPCGTAGEFHMRPLGNAVLHFQLRDLLDNQILFEHTMRKPDAFIVSAQRFFVIRLENGSFRGFGFADGAAAYEMKKQVQKAVKPYSIQESGGESFARASPSDEPKASTSDRQLQTTGSTDKKVSTVVSYESVPRRSSGRPSQLSKEQRMPSVPCLEVATFSPTPKSSMFRSKWKLVLKGFTSLSHLRSLSAISQVLGWREHEMEIGYPTDVKHVAHIGWDGPSVGGPNWVNDSSPTSFWFHLKGFSPKNPIYHYFSMKKFHGSRADNVKHCDVMQIDELKPSPDFSSGPLREFCQPRGSDWIHDALSAAKWAAPGLGENFGPPPGPPAEFSDSDMVQLGQRSSKWKFFRSRHKSMAPPNELPCPPQNIKCQYNPS